MAAPGDVFLIGLVPVRATVAVIPRVGEIEPPTEGVVGTDPVGVTVGVGAIVSCVAGVGGAIGGVSNQDLSGSIVVLLTTYTVSASGNLV